LEEFFKLLFVVRLLVRKFGILSIVLDKGGEVRVAGNLGEVGFAAEMGWVVCKDSFLAIG
jgi:hypothetical protein